jgi:TonB dependent receptor/Carboxypeptidase regulatory-like domain/Secretin and TonB N terminus short domain/TonB-dependent Receptor Plug Domain
MKKISYYFLIVTMLLLSMKSFAQSNLVSLKETNATLVTILEKLETKTGKYFVYDPKILPKSKKININVTNESLENVLLEVLKPFNISFSIKENQIILKAKASKGNDEKRKFTLSGYIKDKANGEAIGNASIQINNESNNENIGTSSNSYGYFSISLPSGDFELSIGHLNYIRNTVSVSLKENTQVDYRLEASRGNKLSVINVKAKSKTVKQHTQSIDIGKLDIPIAMMKKVPTIAGESDIIKVMQLMPGIKRGGEGTIGMYVRGGGADENLIQLDEATVYNAGHLLGFFSVFNTPSIRDVSFYKAGFPSNYGGRLSSIMDVRMREGNINKHQVEGSLGLISSNITLQGPIKKDKASFMVSARRTYIDKVFSIVGVPLPYYFYDANAKINYNVNKRNKVFVSAYFGNDVLKYTKDFKDPNDTTENTPAELDLKTASFLGNFTSTVRWNHVFKNPKLFMNASLIQTRFRYDISGGVSNASIGIRSKIQDVGAKFDFNYNPDPKHQVKFGGEVIHHVFRPNIFRSTSDSSVIDSLKDGNRINNEEIAIYVMDEWNITDKIKINAGLRNSVSIGKNFGYLGLEPRFNIRYEIAKNHSIKGSYSRMRQNMHLVSSSSLAMPTDLWYPVTQAVKPGISDQISLGYYTGSDKINTLISVEGYYKTLKNLIEYKEGAVLILNENFEKEMVFGSGEAYGTEVFINKTQGKFTGWIGYTLSYATRQFDSINKGKKYFARYDRRHDFSAVALYDISKRIKFSAAWVYSSGSPFTARIGTHVMPNPSNTGVEFVPIYSDKNAYRLASQHRLDIDITILRNPKRKLKGEWHIGAYNAYNRAQPNRVAVKFEDGKYKYEQRGLFGIIPSVAYNFKFN